MPTGIQVELLGLPAVLHLLRVFRRKDRGKVHRQVGAGTALPGRLSANLTVMSSISTTAFRRFGISMLSKYSIGAAGDLVPGMFPLHWRSKVKTTSRR